MATATTYDVTAPTVAKLYPKIMGAMAGVKAALLSAGLGRPGGGAGTGPAGAR